MGLFDSILGRDAEYYKGRAWYEYSNRNLKGALEDINKAIEMNPNDAESYYYRSTIYLAIANDLIISGVYNNTSYSSQSAYFAKLSREDKITAANLGYTEKK